MDEGELENRKESNANPALHVGELENQKAINDMKLYEEEKTKNPDLKPALVPPPHTCALFNPHTVPQPHMASPDAISQPLYTY